MLQDLQHFIDFLKEICTVVYVIKDELDYFEQ
jgi:hypothetical protein